jgi:hypothetical protein
MVMREKVIAVEPRINIKIIYARSYAFQLGADVDPQRVRLPTQKIEILIVNTRISIGSGSRCFIGEVVI